MPDSKNGLFCFDFFIYLGHSSRYFMLFTTWIQVSTCKSSCKQYGHEHTWLLAKGKEYSTQTTARFPLSSDLSVSRVWSRHLQHQQQDSCSQKMQIPNWLHWRSTSSGPLEVAGKLPLQLAFAGGLNAFSSFRALDHSFTVQEWGYSRENSASWGLP